MQKGLEKHAKYARFEPSLGFWESIRFSPGSFDGSVHRT